MPKLIKVKNGLNKVKGIYSLGKSIGIKKGKKDLGIIFSEKICNAAAVYTKNKVKGASIYIDKNHLKNKEAQAIVVNSGIANVATGKKGIKDAEEICKLVAKELGIKKNNVIISSTGVIGYYLPMEQIKKGVIGIKNLLGKNSDQFAQAIMTTDDYKKQIAVKVGKAVVAGVAKGAGMINPDMATMLAYIVTDAYTPKNKVYNMLKNAVDKSFNMISVDNDTSTSDTVVLMANGLAGKINLAKLQEAIDFICIELAKMIAADGEGATKLIQADVYNAKTEEDAKIAAKAIIGSNLVKCAMFGNDPNWGRIICALGYSGANFNPEKIAVSLNNTIVFKNGKGIKFDFSKLKNSLKKKIIKVSADLNNGNKKATAYGCDMTYDYVELNSAYHT